MAGPTIQISKANFSGHILRRGFWLYVWKVTASKKTVLYVGRTGDSSSANASSPFSRLSAHLQSKENAKGNSMHRQLIKAGLDPMQAEFQLAAVGPLFPEQSTFQKHCPIRDRMAAMEKELAERLDGSGWTVIGNHNNKHQVDNRDKERLDGVFSEIIKALR
jgi:hypothetical protein